ncbi:MAG: hypothetical protein M3268_08270, partial [Acidobacteriota bacterium]|nr:hypothetical protein [Acidobacteriota bacterium]
MNTRSLSLRLLASSVALCALAQSSSPQSPAPTQTPAPASQPIASQPATTQSTSPNPQTVATTPAQTRAPRMKFTNHRRVEANTLAPELYSDKLAIKLMLVDLPGAADPRSTWEGTYKLYFVSEASMRKAEEEVLRKSGPGGARAGSWDQSLAEFPEKILLAEGSISKKSLATPQQRVHLQENVAFRDKVPPELRTKAAKLFITYSVKVYDAKLKTPVYHSGLFM